MTAGRVAAVGEAMLEFVRRPGGTITQGFGGDTLNTAIYLARLGIAVDYVTALGDDPESDAMLDGMAAEGVGTARVLRAPDRLPGLYVIDVDARGERRFLYWRDRAPARELATLPGGDALFASFADDAVVYLSGITLAILGPAGRERLHAALDRARASGTRVAFDTNWRPRLWPDRATARDAFALALARADIVFLGGDDVADLWPEHGEVADPERALALAGNADDVVLRLGAEGCRVRSGSNTTAIVPACRVAHVVDTTAAGDAFSAGFLAARLRGASAVDAAATAHRVAATVIGHPGAIIPRDVALLAPS